MLVAASPLLLLCFTHPAHPTHPRHTRLQAVMRRLRLRLNASHVLTHDLLPSLEAGTLPCDDVSAVYSTRPRATLSDFRTGGEDDVAALLRSDGAEWSHVGARCFQV